MFDNEFDPYTVLQNHDNWLAQIAENLEGLAGTGADLAKAIEQQQNLIKHLTIGFQYQHRLIMNLNERLEKMEKQ